MVTLPRVECWWCGREFDQNPKGRPRKFCTQVCRQRDYERRHGLKRGRSTADDGKGVWA